jgi:hypothetical protein
LGELILAASDEARKLNIVLLDEPSEKMLKMNKNVRKEKEVAERSMKDEVVIDVPPGKRVRIVMTIGIFTPYCAWYSQIARGSVRLLTDEVRTSA